MKPELCATIILHVYCYCVSYDNLTNIGLYKLARRLKQLEKTSWDAGKIAKVLEILKSEYISSEESEADDEPPHKVIKYNVRKLPWESRSLRKAKIKEA